MINRTAIIVDLDHTLANPGDRDPWNQDTCMDDALNTAVLAYVENQRLKNNFDFIIVTARPNKSRKITAEWMRMNGVKPDIVFHKPFNQDFDRESALEYKRRILKVIRSQWRVVCAIDDDYEICRMYSEAAVPNVKMVTDNSLIGTFIGV